MQSAYIDKLAFIEIKNRKVLVSLSHGKDTWYIPGGKREEGESDHKALIREVKEELGVKVKGETIKFFGVFEAQAHGKPEGTIVRMTCYTGDYTGMPVASSEIEAIDYIDFEQQKTMTGPVDHLIFEYIKQLNLID